MRVTYVGYIDQLFLRYQLVCSYCFTDLNDQECRFSEPVSMRKKGFCLRFICSHCRRVSRLWWYFPHKNPPYPFKGLLLWNSKKLIEEIETYLKEISTPRN